MNLRRVLWLGNSAQWGASAPGWPSLGSPGTLLGMSFGDDPTAGFLRARDLLLERREEYDAARREFRWPELETFNWALDWFDLHARENETPALRIGDERGGVTEVSFAELSRRSDRAASFLRARGVSRGDRIVVMLDNVLPLWEVMLASIKLGAVVIPSTTLLTPDDVGDRLERGGAKHLVVGAEEADDLTEVAPGRTRIAVGGDVPGWTPYAPREASGPFEPEGITRADDPLLLYFTSGTTARPKLVQHTHQSYPVGHLTTMYWIGLREGDVHWNISSPGWAKHAWSSFFAPWNAGATVFVLRYERFDPVRALEAIVEHGVTTLCAPPTVLRMLVQEDLSAYDVALREAVAAGEPLNPSVIEGIREAWGVTVRDGYGQTETTCQVGNSPGQRVKPGSMGRPMPGYRVELLGPDGRPGEEGEIALRLDPHPIGLMAGYRGDARRSDEAVGGSYYRTGDVASRDDDGYLWYVGRADDVFKAADYRISPFELESVLVEHDAVAEAAVVPSPDPIRHSVPKAFVALRAGIDPGPEVAREILAFCRERLAPYKRIRRVEFAELPKTISGKIRRVELREAEEEREGDADTPRRPLEFWEEEL